jgi:hypothetical protein
MSTTNVTSGPLALILVVVIAALAALLIGWRAGRGRRGRALPIGALAFAILGGAGILLTATPPQPGKPRPAAIPSAPGTPFVASKAAGGKLEALRKAPSVAAIDFMMLWMVPASQRFDLCSARMKHFVQDCRDAVDGMAGMAPPGLPDDLRTRLIKAVTTDLGNRLTSDLADEAIAKARANHPDEMLSFPSPGGTDADFYWCAGGDDAARYQRAYRNALAVVSRAGLKLDGGVAMGRVRVIRTDRTVTGDVVDGNVGSPAVQTMLGLIRSRGGDYTPRSDGSKTAPVSFYTCR